MPSWSEALGQIPIAVAILAVGILLARFILQQVRKGPNGSKKNKLAEGSELVPVVAKLVDALTDGNGDPVSVGCTAPQLEQCTERFDAIEVNQDSHEKMLRKLFGARARDRKSVDRRLDEILDHLTGDNSRRDTPPEEIEEDIDAEDTGRYVALAVDTDQD